MKHWLTVNGVQHDLSIEPGDRLLTVLRGRLGLTGAKLACGVGECGACTVLIGGQPRQACVTLVATVDGPVQTVEALSDGKSDRLREAFADEGGFQCGFCTPGQLVSARALLERYSANGVTLTEPAIRRQMTGNVCRCTGYCGIVRAVRAVDAAEES